MFGSLNDFNDFNIGVWGEATKPAISYSGRAYGVLGRAGNCTTGYNYGVLGALEGTRNGAGVYGTTGSFLGEEVAGHYAGYFEGDTKVNGTLTATNVVNLSDIRLKENIVSLDERNESENALTKVLSMNVVTYNYKKTSIPAAEADTTQFQQPTEPDSKINNQRHFGLLAQELQTIYPDLVVEEQNGYLAINYIELVPILVRSIQELKAELDAYKDGENESQRKSPAITTVHTNTYQSLSKLYQNTPNPFKESTTLHFSLADDARDAAICIFDMTGKTLKKMPISSGMESVSIGGWELGEGIFLYSLVVNGLEVGTQKMIFTK